MTHLTSKDMAAVRLMVDLERELGHMAEMGESLHELVGKIVEQGTVDSAFLVEGQKLDALVQHIAEIAIFCRRVAEHTQQMGFGEEAITAAAEQIRLSSIGDRLTDSAVEPRAQTFGECELW